MVLQNVPAFLQSANATAAIIAPLICDLRTILITALDEIFALVGETEDIILAPLEGTVLATVADVAKLLSAVFVVSFKIRSCA